MEQNNNIITIKNIRGLKLKKIGRFRNKKLSILEKFPTFVYN